MAKSHTMYILLSVFAATATATTSASTSASRPNILFLLADDWGWGDVEVYNGGADTPGNFALTGTGSQTPTLNALAANGTLFTDFHTGQAFCAPSRATFMTGRFPADLGVNTNWNTGAAGAAPNHEVGLPYQLPLPTGLGASPFPGGLANIAHTMQHTGYRTAHYGKWHLGGVNPENSSHPTPRPSEYGFDDTATYGSPIEADPSLVNAHNHIVGYMANNSTRPDWWSADVGDDIRDRGIAFMQDAVGNHTPFYLHLWWHMSHDTIDPRPEQLVDFPFANTCDFPATELGQTHCPSRIFWGAQTWSDKHRFAPVIAAVDALGIRDNTYIIFSTDNGAQSHKWNHGTADGPNAFGNAVGTQGPFRGSKGSLYDGGHRVPFIVSGPGVPKGRVDNSVIGAVDWLPTIADITGAAIAKNTETRFPLRGHSIADIWHGKKNNVLDRGDKPLLWRGGGGPSPCWNRSPALAMRDGDLKLLFGPAPGDRVELYNMSRFGLRDSGDRFESENLASDRPDDVARMMKTALTWHHTLPKSGVPGDIGNRTDREWKVTACERYHFPGLPMASGEPDLPYTYSYGTDE